MPQQHPDVNETEVPTLELASEASYFVLQDWNGFSFTFALILYKVITFLV